MEVPFFDLSSQVAGYRNELLDAVEAVIDSGTFIGGPVLAQFEKDFSNFTGSAHVVGVGNGLDAIRLILEAFGIGPGDEVIVPGFTFYATWLAVMQAGAIPIAVDVEESTCNIDPSLVEQRITARTKAIIAVHLFGRPADMLALKEIAARHGLKLIEDAAQAHGAKLGGMNVGQLGDAAAFSFYPTKNIGALGDGGAVTTDDGSVAEKVTSRRSYGFGKTKYEHIDFGWNSRLDPLQAAALSVSLGKNMDFTQVRRETATLYIKTVGLPLATDLNEWILGSVWHHFTLRSEDRLGAQAYLKSQGIASDVHYPYFFNDVSPVVQYLANKGAKSEPLPVSESISKTIFSLPIGPWMSESQIEKVAQVLGSSAFKVFL